MMFIKFKKKWFISVISISLWSGAMLAPAYGIGLVSDPETFDFGWCPDNAKISAEFKVRNTSVDMIPLESVQAACGCTAAQFTPSHLQTQAETSMVLTFNTRGYTGSRFNKAAQLKTDSLETDIAVRLKGHVTPSDANIVPGGTGIVSFEPNAKSNKKTIEIKNNSKKEMTLKLVQKPAAWAKFNLDSTQVGPQSTVKLTIQVEKPYDQNQDTSLTYEAVGLSEPERFTIAIRTGPEPEPFRRIMAPQNKNSNPFNP